MEYLTTIVNVVGLVALFLYQRYRMKLLSEALDKQETLLRETRSVVSQQATAITSQSTVVDAAIKYSQAFSPERIEQMVRRELEIEHKDEKADLENRIKELSEKPKTHSAERVAELAGTVATRVAEFFSPVMSRYAIHLLSLEPQKREAEIASIELQETRELVVKIVDQGNAMLEAAKREHAP